MFVRYMLALMIGQIENSAGGEGDISFQDTGAGGTPTNNTNVDPGQTASQLGDKSGSTQQPAGAGGSAAKEEPSVDELKRSIRALSQERNALKKLVNNQTPQNQGGAINQPSNNNAPVDLGDGYVDAGTLHPELRGLKYDPDAKEVELDGEWMKPRQARAIIIAEQTAEQNRQALQSREEQMAQSRRESVVTAIKTDIGKSVKVLFPGASDRVLQRMSSIVENAVAESLANNGIRGQFDPLDLPDDFENIVVEGIETGMREAREFAYELQNPQKVAQQRAGEREPVGPGGKAGQPSPKKMTDLNADQKLQERRGIVDRVFDRMGVR